MIPTGSGWVGGPLDPREGEGEDAEAGRKRMRFGRWGCTHVWEKVKGPEGGRGKSIPGDLYAQTERRLQRYFIQFDDSYGFGAHANQHPPPTPTSSIVLNQSTVLSTLRC